jgi:hypothetical protein
VGRNQSVNFAPKEIIADTSLIEEWTALALLKFDCLPEDPVDFAPPLRIHPQTPVSSRLVGRARKSMRTQAELYHIQVRILGPGTPELTAIKFNARHTILAFAREAEATLEDAYRASIAVHLETFRQDLQSSGP